MLAFTFDKAQVYLREVPVKIPDLGDHKRINKVNLASREDVAISVHLSEVGSQVDATLVFILKMLNVVGSAIEPRQMAPCPWEVL